jgi:hypothetical protein
MSILNVNTIQPIGSGTTVTVAATELKTNNFITVGTGASVTSPSANVLTLGTNNAERLRITSAGLIGIGTVSPSGPIHVHVASGTQRSYIEASAAHSFLRLKSGSTSYNSGLEFFSGASNIANITGLGAGGLQFEVNGSERLRIDSSGRLLVGTTSADSNTRLHVSAAENTSDPMATDASIVIANTQNAGNNEAAALKFNLGNTNTASISAHYDSFSSGVNSSLRFYTQYQSGFNSPTERMRIGSEGNLALGGQNTSAYSGHTNFFLGGIANLYAETTAASTGSLSISNNAYINSSSNWVYRVNGKATNLYQYDGGYGFRTVGTGSAGGTISWTETLTITSGGHVLPGANNTYDLGSTAKGWRNVYMNDLNLSNMNGDTNDVDGTQGSWTIQEGKDDLYIINRLNGKKFKIKMEEIS